MKKIVLLSSIFLLSIGLMAQNEKKGEIVEGLNIGDKAPQLSFEDPNGKIISLKDVKGQMVLIDFWASWCGPCRMENPNLVKVYNKYKDKKFENAKGFTIYSYSLDKNKQAWQNAIMKDRLAWPYHVSDLAGWAAVGAAVYKVRFIPQAYLIDGNGIIVGKGNTVRGGSLDMLLNNLLK